MQEINAEIETDLGIASHMTAPTCIPGESPSSDPLKGYHRAAGSLKSVAFLCLFRHFKEPVIKSEQGGFQ